MKKYSFLFLLVSALLIFIGCQKDSDEDEMVIEEDNKEIVFEFPKIRYVDSIVYQEIIKTCESSWDLSVMEESTFVVISYIHEYVVHCVGVENNLYVWFLISFDLDGKMINESRKDYLGRGTYFDVRNMEELKLDSIRNFWSGSIKIDTVSAGYNSFRNSEGFVADQSKTDKKGNTIVFSVFTTKEDAVNAMEARLSQDSCTINIGSTQALPGFWWYQECGLYNVVYSNRWNTIFEVGRNNVEFKAVEDTIFQAGNEILRRTKLLID